MLTYIFGAMAYHNLLRIFGQDHLMGKWDLFKATLIQIFLNQFIPSGGLSGNAYVFQVLAKRKMAAVNIVSVIILDLLTFYWSLALVVIASLIIGWFIYPLKTSFLVILALGLLLYAILSLAVSFIGKKQTIRWIYAKLRRVNFLQKFINNIKGKVPYGITIDQIQNPWTLVLRNPFTMMRVFMYQVCVQLVDAFTIYAFFYGLGSPLDFHLVVIGMILTKTIAMLPISPGSLVLYEAGMSFFYANLGAPLKIAIVVTLLYRFLSFWLPLPIGFFMLDRLNRKADKEEFAPRNVLKDDK